MSNQEQGIFVADRVLRAARYVRIDPFSRPDGGNGTDIVDARTQLLEARASTMGGPPASPFGPNGGMTLFNLGDMRIEHSVFDAARPPERSVDVTKELWTGSEHVLISQAVRCSVAAPTFFPPGRVPSFWTLRKADGSVEHDDLVAADGALAANNPTLTALLYQVSLDTRLHAGRVKASRHVLADYAVLSIGCGVRLGLEGSAKMAAQDSTLDWLTGGASLINVLMNNGQSAHHAMIEQLFATTAASHNDPALIGQYLRIQVTVDKRAKPGEAGYAPPEVSKAIGAMDDPTMTEELVRVGHALGELYRPLLAQFVKSYLVAKPKSSLRSLAALIDKP